VSDPVVSAWTTLPDTVAATVGEGSGGETITLEGPALDVRATLAALSRAVDRELGR
jgi:hypothetical protein